MCFVSFGGEQIFFYLKEKKKKFMKMDKAKMMERYEKWLSKEDGYTRKTMSRKEYSKMMKAFSEAGLKRTNYACSVKNYESEKDYRKARAQWMRQWRKTAFVRRQQGQSPESLPTEGDRKSSQRAELVVVAV